MLRQCLLSLGTILILHGALFAAQATDSAPRQQAPADRRDAPEDLVPTDGPDRRQWRLIYLDDLVKSLPEYDRALTRLHTAGVSPRTREYAGDLRRQVEKALKYIREVRRESAAFVPPRNSELSGEELVAEIVRNATDLLPQLLSIVDAETSPTLDMGYWEFLREVELELLALKWRTEQVP